jgi:hypothetical protein
MKMRSWQVRLWYICSRCIHSFYAKCPFCNSDKDKTDEEEVAQMMKRAEANVAGAMTALGRYKQDWEKAMEL